MAQSDSMQLAQAIVSAHKANIRMADTMAKTPRLITQPVVSRQLKRSRELCGTGLSDVLIAKDAVGLFNGDPKFRDLMIQISAELNTVRRK